MVDSFSMRALRSASIWKPILFKYDGNMRRRSWNCSSPEAKFNSSDCCAAVGRTNRQTRILTMCTDRILAPLRIVPHPLRLQFDQILDLDRLTAAFDAVTCGNSDQAGKSAVAQTGAQIQWIGTLWSTKNQILYRSVSPAMPAGSCLFQIFYCLRFAEAACQADFVVGEPVGFDFVVVQPSTAPIDRNGLTFIGQISIGRVGEIDAVLVFNNHGHRIVNVDVLPPDATIAQVAIFRFTFSVELHVLRVLGDVPVEFALLFEWTNPAVRVAEGIVTPIEFQITEGCHLDRLGIQPPVGQVKMM